jgi:hypothetical protein
MAFSPAIHVWKGHEVPGDGLYSTGKARGKPSSRRVPIGYGTIGTEHERQRAGRGLYLGDLRTPVDANATFDRL